LLQQYVEFTVSPIIRSSMAQYQDQKSWAKASQWSSNLVQCIRARADVGQRNIVHSCLLESTQGDGRPMLGIWVSNEGVRKGEGT